MKIIKPSVELIQENNPYKKIELAGRTCYKSEQNITEDSAERFSIGLMKSRHTAMVEHVTFLFDASDYLSSLQSDDFYATIIGFRSCPFIQMTCTDLSSLATSETHFTAENTRILISANARALNEYPALLPLLSCLQKQYPKLVYPQISVDESGKKVASDAPQLAAYEGISIAAASDYADLTQAEKENHTYYSFRFTTDRGVTHEMVRHRPASYAQESTRYVNYSSEKFGGKDGILFIEPAEYDTWSTAEKEAFESMLQTCENTYNEMIAQGLKAQQARAVLPNALKTEIVMTANLKEWNHFFNLRYHGTTGAPHPDIKRIAAMALDLIS